MSEIQQQFIKAIDTVLKPYDDFRREIRLSNLSAETKKEVLLLHEEANTCKKPTQDCKPFIEMNRLIVEDGLSQEEAGRKVGKSVRRYSAYTKPLTALYKGILPPDKAFYEFVKQWFSDS